MSDVQKKSGFLRRVFNPKRFVYLLRRDLVSGYRGILIAMAAVGGSVFLVSILSLLDPGSPRDSSFHLAPFTPLLFTGGMIFTSLAFKEIHENAKATFYLTLPGTTLEKFVSKLLVTSLGYAIGTLAFYSLLSPLSEALNGLILGRTHELFNPISRQVLLSAAAYLVLQSLFLVGSAYFRRLAFLKTVFAQFVLVVAFAILIVALARLIFWDSFTLRGRLTSEAQTLVNEMVATLRLNPEAYPAINRFLIALRVLFWAALAPVCWLISYFRVSETEV